MSKIDIYQHKKFIISIQKFTSINTKLSSHKHQNNVTQKFKSEPISFGVSMLVAVVVMMEVVAKFVVVSSSFL